MPLRKFRHFAKNKQGVFRELPKLTNGPCPSEIGLKKTSEERR